MPVRWWLRVLPYLPYRAHKFQVNNIQNMYCGTRVLRWFGHVERMDEYRMARRVVKADVSGGRVLGRQRLGWMVDVKVAFGSRGMTMEAA